MSATVGDVRAEEHEPARDRGRGLELGRVPRPVELALRDERATGLPIVPSVEETIVAYDEANRSFTYTGAGLPRFVKDARNRWTVIAVDDQRARVRVEATVEMRGIIGVVVAVPLRFWAARSGRKTLDDLKHCLEQRRPSSRKERQLAGSNASSVR